MIDEMAEEVISLLSNQEKDVIASIPDDELINYHRHFGESIRIYFGLWERKWEPELVDGVDVSKDHPDNVSQLVIESIHSKLKSRYHVDS